MSWGSSLPRANEYLARFGMLFQGAALFDSLSVWENVAFGLIQGRRMARGKAKDIAVEKLGQVGLGAEVAGLYPAELSGGMQKRVGLARAIAADPEIIFSTTNRRPASIRSWPTSSTTSSSTA